MKFVIEKNYMILKVDEKAKVDLYTLIDLEDGTKITAIGAKSEDELKRLDVVAATITLNVKAEKKGEEYLQTVSTFVSKVEKVTA